jgi:hypothetical protein
VGAIRRCRVVPRRGRKRRRYAPDAPRRNKSRASEDPSSTIHIWDPASSPLRCPASATCPPLTLILCGLTFPPNRVLEIRAQRSHASAASLQQGSYNHGRDDRCAVVCLLDCLVAPVHCADRSVDFPFATDAFKCASRLFTARTNRPVAESPAPDVAVAPLSIFLMAAACCLIGAQLGDAALAAATRTPRAACVTDRKRKGRPHHDEEAFRSSRAESGPQVLPPVRATVPPWLPAKSARVCNLPACCALGPPACAGPCSCPREACSARSAWLLLGRACLSAWIEHRSGEQRSP